MLNKIILQGRLTKDPNENTRTTQNGLSVIRFSIAVERNSKSKQSSEYETDFIDCTAWGATADFIRRYFSKGSSIIVEGDLRNNNYTDKQGVKHYANTVNVSTAYFVGNKNAQ